MVPTLPELVLILLSLAVTFGTKRLGAVGDALGRRLEERARSKAR